MAGLPTTAGVESISAAAIAATTIMGAGYGVDENPPRFAFTIFGKWRRVRTARVMVRNLEGFEVNKLAMAGTVLVLLGLLGFAIPMFRTEQTKDVAKIGDLKLQTTESTSHIVPPLLAGGAFVAGIVLIGAGVFQRPQV
jgi:hypothetical protein